MQFCINDEIKTMERNDGLFKVKFLKNKNIYKVDQLLLGFIYWLNQ